MAIGPDEKCVLLTTFKRDGTGVSTPVWWVDMGDGTFGFWTSSASGKAKRLAHTSRVTVQPCNQRGGLKPGTSPEEATAWIVTGAEHEAIRQRVVAKYGFMTKVTKTLAKTVMLVRGKPSFPYGDRGVIVKLGAAAPTP
jgi:PPOX class probable F420-dependent enzyme